MDYMLDRVLEEDRIQTVSEAIPCWLCIAYR